MPTYVRVTEPDLFAFTRRVFEAAGMPPENATLVADNLTQGELHGLGSHGVSRLLPVYVKRLRVGAVNASPNVTVVRRKGSTAVVDGDNGPGAVVGTFAMNLALELAQEHSAGWVAARNSNHYGAAFLYARMALPLGMIGFSSTAAVPQVAPYGGNAAALGTNPLCIAVPGGERGPIILDMATTVVARGKVQLAALEGKSIPLGWAVDAQGRPTADAVAGSKGRMVPLGGYKGYGLALMVEVFSSILAGAAFGRGIGELFADFDRGQRMGHFFGALDVAAFMPVEQFRRRIDDLIAYVKGMPLAEDAEEILVPGEPEARKAAEYRVAGIPIEQDVLATMNGVAAELGVEPLRAIDGTQMNANRPSSLVTA
jgi:LDH2 family malate/lactate/ureidoglycolate dehydrogenase